MLIPPRVRCATALLYSGAVASVIALHLLTNGTLGFHTDELYYIDAGRHPALGYVDFPPVAPLLARLETDLLGATPWNLRLLPTLLGGIMVALSAIYVRRLGGSIRLQALALLLGMTAPYFLGANWAFQTVTFDQLTWMVSLYCFLCLTIDPRPRNWIWLGIALGIGLEVKYTIAGLILGIVAAILITPPLRNTLRTRYPWIACGLALVIWAPNLAWQVAHSFPTLAYLANHRGSGGGPLAYVAQFGVYLFFLLPLWLAGMISLFRSSVLRPVGIACALPLLLFLFVGKSYYAAGTVPIVLAQGLMAISRVRRPKLNLLFSAGVVVAALLELVVFAQLTLPITPPQRLHPTGLDAKNELFADSVGWADIPSQVQTIYRNLPADERSGVVIISAYYGVPGAVSVFGASTSLPPVVSPQLSDYYWLPSSLSAAHALMIDYTPAQVRWMCSAPRLIARLTVPYDVQGLEQGAPVTFCPLTIPVPQAWGRLRNFS